MTLPNFLCIGAQKAGSTWIHNRLRHHPDIFVPLDAKELKYFSRPNHPRRLKGYEAHFDAVTTERWIGESTPGYFWTAEPDNEFYQPGSSRTPDIPQAVLDLLGRDIRLLLSLRHPVDRAISAFYHHFRYGRIEATESILEAGKRLGIIHMGFYQRHFERWSRFYPREQFHISFLDQLKSDPDAVWKDICGFFDVADVELTSPEQADNQGLKLMVKDGLVSVNFEAGNKSNRRFRRLLDTLLSQGKEIPAAPVVTEAEIRVLHELYRPDIEFVMTQLDGAGLNWAETPAQILNRQ